MKFSTTPDARPGSDNTPSSFRNINFQLALHVVIRSAFAERSAARFQGENFPPAVRTISPVKQGASRQIHENKTFPKTKLRRLQWIFGLIEPGVSSMCGAPSNRPSSAYSPRVIGTLNSLRRVRFALRKVASRGDGKRCKRRGSSIVDPDDDQAFAGYFRKKIIAGSASWL